MYLGTLPGFGADACAPTVAFHPADDGSAHAHAVLRDGVEVEADTAITYEHEGFLLLDLAEHGDGVGIGVLGGVDHGLSGGAQHGAESVVDVAVTDTDHFDGDAVFLLHFGGHPFQPGTDGGLGVGGSLVEPTAQGTFLDACQTLLRTDVRERGSARGFMIATVYAVRLSYLALAQTAQQMFVGGVWEVGEMALPHAGRDLLLPTAIFARWRGS